MSRLGDVRASATRWLPFWARELSPRQTGVDLLAGLVIAAVLVPQGMAYALLAGLPPQAGLYASLLPPVGYALFGSSRYLAVGPVAVISLMTATATAALTARHGIDPMAAAALLALLSGGLLAVAGLLRLGFLSHFISRPVLLGFTAAAAIIIGLNQLPHLLGTRLETTLPMSISGVAAAISPAALWTGLAALAVMLLMAGPLARRLSVARPWLGGLVARLGPVAVLVAGAAAGAAGLHEHVAVVGTIPQGLPVPGLPAFDWVLARDALGAAALISLIGFMESISVGRSLAARDRELVSPDRELLGLGAANGLAALGGGYPVTGGLSRTLVAREAGARTPLAGVFAAVGVGAVLLAATAWLEPLPQAVLAAIVLLAVLKLIEVHEIVETWRFSRGDGAVIGLTALAVLVLGVEAGLATGIALSIGLLLWHVSRPHVAIVGRVPGTEHYRNRERHRVIETPGVLLLRVDESLLFPNTRFLRDRIESDLVRNHGIHHLVLVANAVNDIDSSALQVLRELAETLHYRGVRLHLAEVKGPVMDRLQRVGFPQPDLGGRVFLSTQQAATELAVEREPPAPELSDSAHAREAG